MGPSPPQGAEGALGSPWVPLAPTPLPPAARSLEDSRKGWFFGLLVYDGSRTIKALGGQVAGHTNKPKNQKTKVWGMYKFPSQAEFPKFGFLVFWF